MGVRRITEPPRAARRTGGLIAVCLAVVLLVTACTTDGTPSAIAVEPPHRLTAEQAGQLSKIRYTNFTTGTRGVRVTLPEATDQPALEVVGYYDFTQHLGYAKVDQLQDGSRSVLGLVSWTPATIGVADATRDDLPLPIPAEATPLTPLDPATSTLNTMLAIIANLGADQPEDAELLEQSDALWLRAELLNGVPVSVYAGPSSDVAVDAPPSSSSVSSSPSGSVAAPAAPAADGPPLEYWVTSGGDLRRVQKVVDTGDGSTGTAVIDFLSSDGVTLAEPTGPVDSSGPTTGSPSTDAPPTDAPPTDAPTTDAPTTDAPLTDAPFTDAPFTDVPFTDVPFTEVPFTDPPLTEEQFPGVPLTDAPFTGALPTGAFPTEVLPTELLPTGQEGPG